MDTARVLEFLQPHGVPHIAAHAVQFVADDRSDSFAPGVGSDPFVHLVEGNPLRAPFGGPGYRLNEWIAVRDAESKAEKSSEANDAPAEGPEEGRPERILAELRKGEKLRAPAIAARLGCCTKTVKRELDALRTEEKVEFIGPSKTGHYRLTE